jgi:PAS domain S-box-containing protein
MKLLAKTPEDRYQTAGGVERDLRHCLTEWEASRRIDDFRLGLQDTPNRLLIPEKLYGRAREIDALLASFNKVVATGRPELVLVSGYSGIGKSSLVNELHKALVPLRGLFASGKFDQYKRDIPYATLAQAFQSLVRPLLSLREADLNTWRQAFRETLHPNAQLIVDLVPELGLILGEQPAPPDLPPQDAQSRFQRVLRRFTGVFARPEHPLALFLDDLQWLDPATLDFLEDLLTRGDVSHLLLIGAYRDNEVDSNHPLVRKFEAIRKATTSVQQIVLGPLTSEHIQLLISDSLCCEPEDTARLAQLVHQKTIGNPFFAIHFISDLDEKGLLAFDHSAAQWSWDLDRIYAEGYTDNVVDLLVARLNRLPAQTRRALELLACFGHSAEDALLARAYEGPGEELRTDLWDAVQIGLVFHSEGTYRFLHDRVQEAAYSQIPEEARGPTHLRIGRLLASRIEPAEIEGRAFEIVNQFNRGSHLITSPDERTRVARLNLIAGTRARVSTAYASAIEYLAAGRALLTEADWEHSYELIFSIELQTAECELLIANKAAAEPRLSMLAERAETLQDNAAVARSRLTLYTTLSRGDRAVEVCLEFLRRYGTDWSPHPTWDQVRAEYEKMWFLLGDRSVEELIHLPSMTDPHALATLDLLAEAVTPALFTDENLLSLVVCRMVNLSLEHGNSDGSCFAYVCLGFVTGPRFGDYEAGFRFGQVGCELVEKRGLHRFSARTYLTFGHNVMPSRRHLRAGRDLIRRAFEIADRIGDLTFAFYSRHDLIENLLAVGDPLEDTQREAEKVLTFAEKAGFDLAADITMSRLCLIRTLRGLTYKFGCFNDAKFDELAFERHLAANGALASPECWYWIRKLQALFFAGDYSSAIEASTKAHRLVWAARPLFEIAEYVFYTALSRAAIWDSAAVDERQHHFEALVAHHKQIEVWAANCPDNFESRSALVGAEIARIEGRDLDAMRLYEQAVHSARDKGFVHHQGIASELAGRFYLSRGLETNAYANLRNASACFGLWGADGKVAQLESLYPGLAALDRPKRVAESLGQLDVAAIVNANQAVSGEMTQSRLIERLMTIALQNGGADRGLLLLSQKYGYRVEAEARANGDNIVVRQDSSADQSAPDTVIRYVMRMREPVILDDSSSPGLFVEDEYLCRRRTRSLLCLPLVRQGSLSGLLYLENTLTTHAFTPGRTAVLKFLATQAAISLENTRLYADLQEREARVRRLVDANIIGIIIADREGRIVEANDAFLRIIGYDRDDLNSGRVRWNELTPPDWRERDIRALAELNSTRTVQPFEKEYFRKDGSRVPVLLGGALFKEDGNEAVVFVLDLTERKRAEGGLRESEAKFRAAIDGIAGLVAIMAPSGELESVNGPLIDYFGRSVEELKNWGTTDVVHPEDLPRVLESYETSLAAGTPFHHELRLRRFDGAYRWFENRGAPIRDESGRITRWYCLLTDIEDRTQALARLQQMQSDFAHMNRVSMMGELAASLSHEILHPIATARNNARAGMRFLEMNPPNLGEVKEALDCVVRDADRARDIVGRMRDHIKKAPPRKERFDLNAAIDEVLVLAQSATHRNEVSVQTRLADGLGPVLGDRIQLQQVLLNLILNAAEAMSSVEEGTRELLISTEQDQTSALVAVRDSGPGIDAQHLDRVFDAFYTTKSSGTGMGLSICRSIIHAHGGKLWAETNEPRGAVFLFTLPADNNS